MSSITNVTTGEVQIADPLAIAYQAGGADVAVTAATPLPITGSITTTQGPVQYVNSSNVDVEVKEGVTPLPVSVEATVAATGPIEFKNAGGVDTVVQAGSALTSLPINAEGGTIDTVSTVTSVTDVANVQSVDNVDNVTSVDTVDIVTQVSKSVEFHLNAGGAAVSTATDVNRQPVTERGISWKANAFTATDVGNAPAIGPGGGVIVHAAASWERISMIGVVNNSTPGEFAFGIRDVTTGTIVYSGEGRIMASTTMPGSACMVPRELQEPITIPPTAELAVWHSGPGATVYVNFLVETLE